MLELLNYAEFGCFLSACWRKDFIRELNNQSDKDLATIMRTPSNSTDILSLFKVLFEYNQKNPVHFQIPSWPSGITVCVQKIPLSNPCAQEIIFRVGNDKTEMIIPWVFPFVDFEVDVVKELKDRVDTIQNIPLYVHQPDDILSNSMLFVLGEFRDLYDNFSADQKQAFTDRPKSFLQGFATQARWERAGLPVQERFEIGPLEVYEDKNSKDVIVDIVNPDPKIIIGTKPQGPMPDVDCYPCFRSNCV